MQIRIINNTEIDTKKWDACLTASASPVAYASLWYLTSILPNWRAIIVDDYRLVMPIPSTKKYFLPFAMQPYYCQQLGLFGKEELTEIECKEIARLLKQHFVYGNIQINKHSSGLERYFKASTRINYEMQLNKPYEELRKAYSTNTKRNIAKANKSGLTVHSEIEVSEFMLHKEKSAAGKYGPKILSILNKIASKAIELNKCEIIGVYDEYKELHAIALFIKEYNRIIYLNAFSTEIGKTSKAMFLLVDEMIQHNADTECVIDFEGSDIESIARFYSSFGAKPIAYHRLKWHFNLF